MKSLFTAVLIWGSVFGGLMAKADVCNTSGNLVANCGFETGSLAGWSIQSPTNEAGNWYGVDTFDAYSGADGAYLAGFGSYDAGSSNFALIGQNVSTVVGKPYYITYEWAHNTSSDPAALPDNFFTLGINGFVAPGTEEINVGNQAFTLLRYTFFATTSNTLVEFEAQDANSYFSLDDVYLAAVPEPASFVSVVLSLSGLSIFLLRRKVQS